MRIGVDVDLTVVDTAREWYNYLMTKTSLVLPSYDEQIASGVTIEYDYAKIFTDLSRDVCLEYWRPEGIYDGLSPIKDSVEVLQDLKFSKGYDIVFVSTIKGNHHKSKYYFLKKNFPFMDGLIATKEKEYAKVDMLIDDRCSVLQRLIQPTFGIQFKTPFDQYTDFKPSYVCDSWEEIHKLALRNF